MLVNATYVGGQNYIYVSGYKFLNGIPRDANLPSNGMNIVRRAAEEGWFIINQDYEGGFVTPESQEKAINNALSESKEYTDSKFEQMDIIKVVPSVDRVTEEGVLYLVAKSDEETQESDIFDEYVFENGKPEHIGTKTAKVDFENYYDKIEIDNKFGDIETALSNKADKSAIVKVEESSYLFEFADLYNKIVRAKTMESISFNIETGEYSNLYEAELCFDSGETPTRIDYAVPENPEQIQVINWVGVDCANTSYVNSAGETVPISVFSPVANKHYEIVFQYNGTQLIAWVGGFTPAGGNVVSA